jgi:TrmH family RNA methyltransferase
MKNMGLSQLVLVQPEDFPSSEAVARASGATDILDAALVVDTLEEALTGCSVVLGTSARDRRIPWPLLDPRECASTSLEHLGQGGQVALVFGREYAGLTNEELQRCHFHVHIPSDPEFGSLNLAAAVQVLTYEVAALQLLIGQPGVFAAKYQRNLPTLPQMLQGSTRTLSRIQQRPGNAPIPRTGTQHHTAAGQSLFQGIHHQRRIENIGRTGSPRDRLATGKVFRLHQHQLRQAHVFHGSRSAADIAMTTLTI